MIKQEKNQKTFFVALHCCITALLLTAAGCSTYKEQGKFTEEEMESFSLVKKQSLPKPSGGFVLSVNTETITADEVLFPLTESLAPIAEKRDFARFKTQAKPAVTQVLKNKLTDILLYQRAKREIEGNIDDMLKLAVQTEVSKFIAGYDNNYAEAQTALEKMGMTWQQFRDYQKRVILTQSYISKELNDDKSLSRTELLKYYNLIKDRFQWDAMIEFSLIDIVPAKLDPNQINSAENESKEHAAIRLAENLILEILNEKKDFGELAKKYSHGHNAQMNGKWKPVTTGSLAKPYDQLETNAQKMQPGQISKPIKTDGHVFVMKLENKIEPGCKTFEQVQQQIETQVRFLKRKERFETIVSSLIAQANIENMDAFVNFCLERAYRQYQ